MQYKIFLEEKPQKLLHFFANQCINILGIDIIDSIKECKSYYNNKKIFKNKFYVLEERWYNSLNYNMSDYSIYNEDDYLADLWVCWQLYSRNYLRDFNKIKPKNIKTIIDVGCGIGYTTVALKQMFPKATVYGTNLLNTKQMKICKDLENYFDIKFIEKTNTVKENKIDLIFASEYFEHFEEPIKHFEEINQTTNFKYILIANSFNTKSVGHFNHYIIDKNIIEAKKIPKLFNNYLRQTGFKKHNTNFWNDRPNLWERKFRNIL